MPVTEVKIRWWHYLVSIPYLVSFLTILVAFDLAMRIARLFSYSAFRVLEYWMCRSIHANLSVLAGVRFLFEYPEHWHNPEALGSKPSIVISNHQSMYDVSLLDQIFTAHDPRFISKKELAAWVPAVSFISRNNKTVLIDRNDRKHSLNAMQQGAALAARECAAICIFPEGTRAKDGEMKKFKTAGLHTLIQSMPDALLVPVTIDGTWQILRYAFWPVPWGIQVKVTIGEPQEISQGDIDTQLKRIEDYICLTLKG